MEKSPASPVEARHGPALVAARHGLPRIITTTLRHPHLAALTAGAIAACGFQPLSWWPLTLVAVGWLIALIDRAHTAKRAFVLGWLFGLSHFSVGDSWIATAFTYQAEMPSWLGAVAVVLLSIYLAVYPALAALFAWWLVRGFGRDHTKPRAILGIALAGTWILTEWLRSWVFTGFAWNPLGIAFLGGFDTQGVAVFAPWLGTYGLSGLLVLVAAALRFFLWRASLAHGRSRVVWGGAFVVLTLAVTAQMVLPARDPAARDAGSRVGTVPFTLIQPDLRQEALNDSRNYEPHFIKMARLSIPQRAGEARVVFWPESGLGDYLRDGYPDYFYRQVTYAGDPVLARERIGQVIGSQSMLLTGAVDLVVKDETVLAARNSVTAIDGRGSILAGYSKAHLVPYGEYLALRWLLEPLGATRLVPGALDFWPGPGPQTYDFGKLGKAGMQICYEIVFSGQVVDRSARPDYIFNPSNDGWFGSWGPPQHLAQARLRAMEEGLPVLRSTTTGISAVIDADGLVRQWLPTHVAGRMDGLIPPPKAPTFFALWGNAIPLVLALLLLIVSMVACRFGKDYRYL